MSKETLDLKIKITDKYCDITRELMGVCYSKRPDDQSFYKMKERLNLAISTDQLTVLKKSGPYLYKFKDQIIAADVSFFMDMDYDLKFKHIKGYSPDIVVKIRELWNIFTEEEKQEIKINIQKMLLTYLEYLEHFDDGDNLRKRINKMESNKK